MKEDRRRSVETAEAARHERIERFAGRAVVAVHGVALPAADEHVPVGADRHGERKIERADAVGDEMVDHLSIVEAVAKDVIPFTAGDKK